MFRYLHLILLATLLNTGCSERPAEAQTAEASPDTVLVFPGLLNKKALEAGNPLATYAAMIDLEKQYQKSEIFAQIYPEIRLNFEQFLGFPRAGLQAMSLPMLRRGTPGAERPIPDFYTPENALEVIKREALKTRIVIWGEEHHLPQTRALYASILRSLWDQGYRYLAAEAFEDAVMDEDFLYPDYRSGYYLRDPVFASAIRTAKELGYTLIAYDTKERGGAGFRDKTQAQNIKARIFDGDAQAKVFVIAGRGHASEEMAADGWTPMASVLKQITGIDPLTLYAPTMSERLTSEEEHPYYRFATSQGLVDQPTIFEHRAEESLLGTSSFDAYIFWPRTHVEEGRPDWMVNLLGRTPVKIPESLLRGSGMRLVQAFREGDSSSAVPIDQVIIDESDEEKVLMLPAGAFWLRTVNRDSAELARTSLEIR